jgi:Zn-dependent protease
MVRFRLFGFPTRIEGTALVLAALLLAFGLRDGTPGSAVLMVVLGAGSILAHELGHAFMARAFRLQPIEMALHGFGGLTRHRRPNRPWKELAVTLAGPAAGLALAAIAFGVAIVAPGQARSIATQLGTLNLIWSVFNLLPVYPMDGGMALSATLRMFAPALALPVTYGAGLTLSVGMVGLALWAGEILIVLVLGTFVVQNATQLHAWWSSRATD